MKLSGRPCATRVPEDRQLAIEMVRKSSSILSLAKMLRTSFGVLLIIGTGLCWSSTESNSDYSGDDRSDHDHSDHKGFLDFLFGDYATDWNCRCGLPNRGARVLGGEYLKTHEFPWLAIIQVQETSNVPGTLINDRYVLTAGSQMIGLTPYDIKVTLGQFDRCFPDVTSQNVSASAIFLHPDFSPGNRANDIALVKLTTPLLNEKRIRPICLSFPGRKYTGHVATVVGWAEAPLENGETSATCRPRKAGLPVLTYSDCVATAADPAFTSSDKGCVGIVGTRSIVCTTDAGGPVMFRSRSGIYEIIGVLSDKNDCADIPSTALFTQVNSHLEWIKRHTKDAVYCIKSDY